LIDDEHIQGKKLQLTFTAKDERVDQDLRTIVKVTELRLPDDQIVGIINRMSIFKAQHRFLGQNAVGDLILSSQSAFHGIQRHKYFIRILIDEHCVTLSKRSTANVFARDPHIVSLIHQAAESESFCCCPIDCVPLGELLDSSIDERLLDVRMNGLKETKDELCGLQNEKINSQNQVASKWNCDR